MFTKADVPAATEDKLEFAKSTKVQCVPVRISRSPQQEEIL